MAPEINPGDGGRAVYYNWLALVVYVACGIPMAQDDISLWRQLFRLPTGGFTAIRTIQRRYMDTPQENPEGYKNVCNGLCKPVQGPVGIVRESTSDATMCTCKNTDTDQ